MDRISLDIEATPSEGRMWLVFLNNRIPIPGAAIDLDVDAALRTISALCEAVAHLTGEEVAIVPLGMVPGARQN